MSAISIFYFVLEAGVQEVVTLNNGDVSECTSRDAVRLIVGEDQWDMLLQFFLDNIFGPFEVLSKKGSLQVNGYVQFS